LDFNKKIKLRVSNSYNIEKYLVVLYYVFR